jgi:hypothetical protein
MFRRTTLSLLVLGGLTLAAAPVAHANIPGANSTGPAFIRLVGSAAGVPDTVAGKFTVTIRDIANNPINVAYVTIDLSGCADMRLASDQLNPNVAMNCFTHAVSAYTNAAGVVTFTLIGNSWNAGTYSALSCARIYANGVLMFSPTVSSFDLDGANGVNVADLSVMLADIGLHVYRGRDDYDANAIVNVADLSLWLAQNGTHRSAVTGATCP